MCTLNFLTFLPFSPSSPLLLPLLSIFLSTLIHLPTPITILTSPPLAWLATSDFKNRDAFLLDTRGLCTPSHTPPSLPYRRASVCFFPESCSLFPTLQCKLCFPSDLCCFPSDHNHWLQQAIDSYISEK